MPLGFGYRRKRRQGRWHNTHLFARHNGRKKLMYVNGTTGRLAFRVKTRYNKTKYIPISEIVCSQLQYALLKAT